MVSTFEEKEVLVNKIFQSCLNAFVQSTPVDTYKETFITQMKKAESTDLFKLLKIFPKGSALHQHWVASGLNSSLIQYVLDHPTIFYQCIQAYDKYTVGGIRFFKSNPGQNWKRIDQVLEEVGKESFTKNLLEKMSFSSLDESGSSETRWKKFQSIFNNYYFGLTFFKSLALQYHLDLVKSFIEDNIQYAEFRSPFTYFYDEQEKQLNQHEAAQFFKECNEASIENFGTEDWFGSKWIHESMRVFDKKTVREAMEVSYKIQNEFKNFIIGFDLVGEEDTGHTCDYFAQDVKELKEKAKQEGKEFEVVFHLGESNHPNNNIEEGLKLGTKRIGHGYNLIRYPAQAKLVKENDTPLEVCPASNMVLGLVQDRRNHPMVYFLANEIPFVISSDDPQIFGYSGITHDFFLLVTATQMNLSQLKTIALNSIKYAIVTEQERCQLYRLWNKKYEIWMDEVLHLYSNKEQ